MSDHRQLSQHVADLSGPALTAALTADSILVQPIGAIEHHGPHLPLATDALIAESSATASVARARAAGFDIWQLPTLAMTKSDEHAWAPGTLWLEADTLFRTLVDLGRSIAATPAKTLVFLNGHGGNVALLNVVNRELRRRFGLRTFAMPASNVPAATGLEGAPDELGMGIHAGFAETSIVMHLRPDLVDETLFARNVPEHLAELDLLGFNGKPVTFGWLSNDFGPSGVIGDPTGANAVAGRMYFESGVEFALRAFDQIRRFRYA